MTTNLHDKMLAAIDALFSASDAVEEEVAENLLLDVRDAINKHKLAAESLTEGLRLDDWPKIGCVNHDCDECKALAEQPAQDNTYGYAKGLAESLFKKHYAHEEHYASGRIVWEVSDTTIGLLTQIDNMVCPLVRPAEQPVQQEPVAWQILNGVCHAGIRSSESLAKEAASGMQKTHDLGGSLAAFHVRPLYTAPQPQSSKPWVGLTDEEVINVMPDDDNPMSLGEAFCKFAVLLEAKLKEKNT